VSELISMRAAEASLALAEGPCPASSSRKPTWTRIEATESRIGAFLARSSSALNSARDIDTRRAAGEKLALWLGSP